MYSVVLQVQPTATPNGGLERQLPNLFFQTEPKKRERALVSCAQQTKTSAQYLPAAAGMFTCL